MNAVCIGTTLCIFAARSTFAQPAASPLTFEVASVKPSGPNSPEASFRNLPGGGFISVGAPLKSLISIAYAVREFQISGGPEWINSGRFDINARPEVSTKAEPSSSDSANISVEQQKSRRQQMQERLQNLLGDRFRLAVHRDTKEQQVYALVIAKGGPKIQESKQVSNMMRTGRGLLTAHAVGMADFSVNLSNRLGRPVIDKTGLTGKYDLELKWTPDPGQTADGPFGPLAPPSDPNGPSLFTALQEQLGLRLESQKGPVETLVIDRVEKPSEN